MTAIAIARAPGAGTPVRWRLLVALVLSASGCGDAQRPADRLQGHDRPPPRAEVVARVDGTPILASDLRQQMSAGKGRRQALEDLIRFELLAGETRRRGLDREPEVSRVMKQALANLLVRRAFGDSYTEQSIPRHMVERFYRANRLHYDRPEAVKVAYLALQPAVAGPPRCRKRQPLVAPTARSRQRARVYAQRALGWARAAKVGSAEDLKQIGLRLQQEVLRDSRPDDEDKIDVLFHQVTSSRTGGKLKAYSDAAFALRPGQLSGVVEVGSDYYIIFAEDRLEARRVSLSEAEAEIRRRIFDDARELSFLEFVAGLERQHRVALLPEALEPLDRRHGGQPP